MNYRRGVKVQLILILILTAAAWAVFLPGGEGAPARDASSETVPLVDRPVYEISAVALINEKARFGLIHREGQISLEPLPEGLNPSAERLQAFLFRLSKLEAAGLLEGSGGPAAYGLDEPRARITLITSDGRKTRLALGRESPADGSYYLRRDDEDRVYLLSAEDGDLFLSRPEDFESLRLLPRVNLEDLDSLEALSVDFPGEDLPSYTLENRGNFLLGLTAPIENSVGYESALSDLIFPVLSLSASEKIGEDAAGGGDEAEMILSVRIDGNSYRLSFYPDGLVRREGDPALYRLEEGIPEFRTLRYSDLLEGAAYHINVSEIESITVHDGMEKKDYNIGFSGEATEIHGNVNGFDLDYPETMELYETLFRMTIAGELSSPQDLDNGQDVSLEMVIHKKNGSLDKLSFVSREGELLLYVDGKANFTSYNKTVLDIRALLSRIAGKEGA